jgi:hypothetical protein
MFRYINALLMTKAFNLSSCFMSMCGFAFSVLLTVLCLCGTFLNQLRQIQNEFLKCPLDAIRCFGDQIKALLLFRISERLLVLIASSKNIQAAQDG